MVALLLRYLCFPFQAVECLLRRTSASDVEKEATAVLLAEDFSTDSDPQAKGSKEQLAHLERRGWRRSLPSNPKVPGSIPGSIPGSAETGILGDLLSR